MEPRPICEPWGGCHKHVGGDALPLEIQFLRGDSNIPRSEMGGGQSWGHIGVSPIWKSQPCYQGGSSTAGGINVKFWAGTRRGQSFEDICTLQEELEEREIRAHYRGKGRKEGFRCM